MKEARKHKISFCTVSMNRLNHLKQTLPVNIEDNLPYGEVEFLLLDYNSTDGLEDWVRSEMQHYIDKGILIYYKTTQPDYFHRSHSRNMILKKATGDIVCNVDADNFTGMMFAAYINDQFNQSESVFLGIDFEKQSYLPEAHGRFCALREDFLKVTGYDESMDSYGYEDIDLTNRLELLGKTKLPLSNFFLKYISHSNIDRIENEVLKSNLIKFLIRYINEQTTEVIMLQRKGKFNKVTLVPLKQPEIFNTMAHVEEGSHFSGTWQEEAETLTLNYETGKEERMRFNPIENAYVAEEKKEKMLLAVPKRQGKMERKYTHITHDRFITKFLMEYSRMIHLKKLKTNMASGIYAINTGEIGVGTVYRNFNYPSFELSHML